jgi:hypothetical protein
MRQLTNATTNKCVTIFEGCDGGGKTTLAQAFAHATHARYVHFHNLPRVKAGLPRLYAEAMLPALLGYQDVVLDRCWLSERPYGAVMRHGEDRMGDVNCCLVERLAMRCGAVVIYCCPPWDTVRANYVSRGPKVELLEDTTQLQAIYDLYQRERTHLPLLTFDYTHGTTLTEVMHDVTLLRMPRHPLYLASAGNWDAPVLLVGEKFAHHRDGDLFYQWPFASFKADGCSHWLTQRLLDEHLFENRLCWVNSDQDLSFLNADNTETIVIAMGDAATKVIKDLHCWRAFSVPHPQAHKRFHHTDQYELIDLLQRYFA